MEDAKEVARRLVEGPDPNTANMPVALAGLIFGLELAHGRQPELYVTYVPALVDLTTHKLHLAERPHSGWHRQGVVRDTLVTAARMTSTELLVSAVAVNMARLAHGDHTHALLFGEWEMSNLAPAVYKRADLAWCEARLGWRSVDVARRMRDVHQIMSQAPKTGYFLSHASTAFRLYALGILQATLPECACCSRDKASFKCSGCGKRRYCSQHCQSRHWRLVHKAECQQLRQHTYLSFETHQLLADV